MMAFSLNIDSIGYEQSLQDRFKILNMTRYMKISRQSSSPFYKLIRYELFNNKNDKDNKR